MEDILKIYCANLLNVELQLPFVKALHRHPSLAFACEGKEQTAADLMSRTHYRFCCRAAASPLRRLGFPPTLTLTW